MKSEQQLAQKELGTHHWSNLEYQYVYFKISASGHLEKTLSSVVAF